MEQKSPSSQLTIDQARKKVEKARAPLSRAQALLEYSKLLYQRNPVDCERCAKEAFTLGVQCSNVAVQISALSLEGIALRMQMNLEPAMEVFQQLSVLSKKHNDRATWLKTYARMAEVRSVQGRIAEAVQLVQEGWDASDADIDLSARSQLSYLLGSLNHNRGEYVESIRYYEESISLHLRLGDRVEIAAVRSGLCSSLVRIGRYAEAISQAREAIADAELINDSYVVSNAYLAYGFALLELGDLDAALKAFLTAYDTSSSVGEGVQQINMLNNIAVVYTRLQDYPVALRFQEQALELSRKFGAKRLLALNLVNLSYLYGQTGDFAKTISTAKEGYEIASSMQQQLTCASAQAFIAWAHYSLGHLTMAHRACLKTVKMYTSMQNESKLSESYRQLGEIELAQGRYEESVKHLHQSLSIAENLGVLSLQAETHQILSLVYEKRQADADAQQALQHLRKLIALKEQYSTEQKQKAVLEMQIRFDTERAIAEREEMRRALELKTRELANLAIQLAEKNQLVAHATRTLKKINAVESSQSEKGVSSLMHELEVSGAGRNTWGAFEEQFSLVHAEFLKTLALRFPSLSATEMKVCALLKLQLNTKQIAAFLQVTTRAIDKQRNNIRKKLQLPLSANLNTVLAAY